MRIAIDALPVNNFSGRHVLLGHLRNLAEAGRGRHRYFVFHHAGNRDLCRDLGDNVEWIECPGVGGHWLRRLLWQYTSMQAALRKVRAELLLSTSGALVPGVYTPQLVLAQNPWCFFPQFHQRATERVKASLQRFGYRAAQRRARAMFYLSDYMARAYLEVADSGPRHGATVLVGINDRMFELAQMEPSRTFDQRAIEILTVSVMTPHKSVEDVIEALALLIKQGVNVRLSLVGPWSDALYRAAIEQQIASLGLSEAVTITGAVSDNELANHYRRARVFCLLSRCESFGIPSVEAHAFGTPTVVANVCAPPEIAGPGGNVVPAGCVELAADALRQLLVDANAWQEASEHALTNAERFRWRSLSGPIIEFIDRWPAHQ
jgi:glycosyltransferase involved in cell wall biosynthesis